jgi:hypothetical protein
VSTANAALSSSPTLNGGAPEGFYLIMLLSNFTHDIE